MKRGSIPIYVRGVMTVRILGAIFFAVHVGTLLLIGCGSKSAPEARRPNVVLVTVDTLRADRIGCYGNDRVKTPFIDGLAKDGTLFRNVYCQAPTTGPSHSSILTSLYPRSHHVEGNARALDEENLTLPEVLKKNGYATAAFVGVWVLDDRYGFGQGFDHFTRSNDEEKPAEVRAWIDTNKDENFFVWLHIFAPHLPYSPPEPYAVMYDPDYKGEYDGSTEKLLEVHDKKIEVPHRDLEHIMALYDGEVTYTDKLLSDTLSVLDDLGLKDDTMVVFTADHGEELYEHDHHFGHSLSVYEPAIRVPLIITYPANYQRGVQNGKKLDSLTESIDIAPTILDLLDIHDDEWARQAVGRSMLPYMKGGPGSGSTSAYCETFVGDGKDGWLRKTAVISQPMKLISTENTNVRKLYNIDTDPLEHMDLAEERPEELKWMNAKLGSFEARFALPSVSTVPDEETLKRLKSLGYIR